MLLIIIGYYKNKKKETLTAYLFFNRILSVVQNSIIRHQSIYDAMNSTTTVANIIKNVESYKTMDYKIKFAYSKTFLLVTKRTLSSKIRFLLQFVLVLSILKYLIFQWTYSKLTETLCYFMLQILDSQQQLLDFLDQLRASNISFWMEITSQVRSNILTFQRK